MFFTLTFSIAVVIIVAYLISAISRCRKLPPGPLGWPVIGSFRLRRTQRPMNEFMAELHEKYGDITSLRVGSKLFVFLHTYDAVREAFVEHGEVFSGRPVDITNDTEAIALRKGIVWSEGDVWKRLRRFSVSSLRDFGMGKLSIEGKIQEEVAHFCEELTGRQGQSFDPYPLLSNAVSNVTCNIVFGNRFDYSDDRFKELITVLNDLLSASPFMNVVYFFPWLRHIFFFRKSINKEMAKMAEIQEFIHDQMNEHRESRSPESMPRDFLDAIMDASANDSKDAEVFAENLVPIITQLFIAGTDTTATTLQWIMWFLLRYPEEQEKLRAHIAEVSDSNGQLSYEERTKVPYLEAFILEVQRLANIAPMSLPHTPTEDVQLRGYTIPARSTVHASFLDLHSDPVYWTDPDRFNPERFLMQNGQVNYRHPSFMPFSTGRRVCLGESLAKNEIFSFTADLVQRFKLMNPTGIESPKEGYQYGLTTHPIAYQVQALPI